MYSLIYSIVMDFGHFVSVFTSTSEFPTLDHFVYQTKCYIGTTVSLQHPINTFHLWVGAGSQIILQSRLYFMPNYHTEANVTITVFYGACL